MWNDLAENDIIYPAEGAEYVLKGSELVEGCSGTITTQYSLYPFGFICIGLIKNYLFYVN